MGDLRQCVNCGLVMGGGHRHCIGCGADADQPASENPPAPTATAAADPIPRPDPYSQISNPLHTDWNPHAPHAATTDDVSYTVQARHVRSPWIRRLVIIVLLVALAAGAWLAREQIGSVYDDLSDRISSDEAHGYVRNSTR